MRDAGCDAGLPVCVRLKGAHSAGQLKHKLGTKTGAGTRKLWSGELHRPKKMQPARGPNGTTERDVWLSKRNHSRRLQTAMDPKNTQDQVQDQGRSSRRDENVADSQVPTNTLQPYQLRMARMLIAMLTISAHRCLLLPCLKPRVPSPALRGGPPDELAPAKELVRRLTGQRERGKGQRKSPHG